VSDAPRAGLRTQGRLGRPEEVVRGGIREMQRRRMLAAAGEAIAESGWSGLTVAEIIRRARVSRKTFYDIFAGCEDCFLCTFELAVAEATVLARDAYLREERWRDGIRAALAGLLVFLEEDYDRARLLLVESCTSEMVLARRVELLKELASVIDAGRRFKNDPLEPSLLTAEGVIGGVVAIVQARVQDQRAEPLPEIGAQLMSMIVLPYLGPTAARRELGRSVPRDPPMTSSRKSQSLIDPIAGLNMRLTYRTVQVLRAIRESPGASNRAIATACGIADQGQISKLAARLERLQLVENHGEGPAKGAANAWHLSTRGARLERAAREY
jgi:AcrR family transcriptional regulator